MQERIKGLCGDLAIESDSKGTGIRVTIPVMAPEPVLQFPGGKNAIGE
jgi:signal transduction histidine kinase